MTLALSVLAVMLPIGSDPEAKPVMLAAVKRTELDNLGGPHGGAYWDDPPKLPWRVRMMRDVVRPYLGWLNATGACESGNNPATNTGNGFYGEFQFTLSSWLAVGGRGMPHWASRLEQRYRAVKLLHLQGRGAWPVCG